MVTKRTPKRLSKKRLARIEEILAKGKLVGMYNLNRGELAEHYGVSKKQIGEDFNLIYERGVKDVVPKLKIEYEHLGNLQIRKLHTQLIKAKDAKTIAIISKAINDAKDSHVKMMEALGVKKKIADKVEVSGEDGGAISINVIAPKVKED